jgi:hypothetical protein
MLTSGRKHVGFSYGTISLYNYQQTFSSSFFLALLTKHSRLYSQELTHKIRLEWGRYRKK